MEKFNMSLHDEEESGNLLEALTTLVKRKEFILGFTLSTTLIAGILALFLPSVYTAKTLILPPQANASASLLSGALGGGVGGLLSGGLFDDPSKLYIGMLGSETILTRIIERFKLQDYYETETLIDTQKALSVSTTLIARKDTIIQIEIENKNPKLAANIANAYVEELQKLNGSLAITEASRRRLFFEKQLIAAKEDLARAELTLKSSQENSGLLVDSQAQYLIANIANLQAQIAAKEVQLNSLGTSATNQNPVYIRLNEELSTLRNQLNRLETNQKRSSTGDISISTNSVPSLTLTYLRNLRNIKYKEKIYELLSQQFELAKVDEARNYPLIQVVDKAKVPDKPSGPKRLLITIVGGVLGFLVSSVFVFLQESFNSAQQDPKKRLQIETLLSSLNFKSLVKRR
jgi:tyrosine-protein kinase Etk/Wzc